jgi:dolichol-phosphate mannosyltransferase
MCETYLIENIMLAHLLLPRTRKARYPISGYFMVKKEVTARNGLNTGFKILLEVLAKGNYSSVAEVPYTFKPRKRGESELKPEEVANYALLLFKLRIGP